MRRCAPGLASEHPRGGIEVDSLPRPARDDQPYAPPVRRRPAGVGCPVRKDHVTLSLACLSVCLRAMVLDEHLGVGLRQPAGFLAASQPSQHHGWSLPQRRRDRRTALDVRQPLRITTMKVVVGGSRSFEADTVGDGNAKRAAVRRWFGEPVKSTLNGSPQFSSIQTATPKIRVLGFIGTLGNNPTHPKSFKILQSWLWSGVHFLSRRNHELLRLDLITLHDWAFVENRVSRTRNAAGM